MKSNAIHGFRCKLRDINNNCLWYYLSETLQIQMVTYMVTFQTGGKTDILSAADGMGEGDLSSCSQGLHFTRVRKMGHIAQCCIPSFSLLHFQNVDFSSPQTNVIMVENWVTGCFEECMMCMYWLMQYTLHETCFWSVLCVCRGGYWKNIH